jgi:hypothetical protein
MIHTIRTSKFSKIIASYLAIQLILTTVQPTNLFALTGGPSQPEFNSFTPIGTSDMVNLSSGDFNYNIPIMDVGGYPLNLAYDSGVSMDQEASWVGLGWNLNVGQINRQVRGLPDDFNGDELIYQNNLKDNKTVGATVTFHPAVIGIDVPVFNELGEQIQEADTSNIDIALGLGVDYNNYTGWSYSATSGVSFKLSDNVTIGAQMTNSSTQGVSISPNLSLNTNTFGKDKFKLGSSLGTTLNSRQGLTNLSITPSLFQAGKKVGVGQYIGGGSTARKSFLNTSYTPTKRNQLINRNSAANGALGFELFGAEVQGEIYVYASEQALADSEKSKTERAYGFNFTENASRDDILDINRENDRLITKNVNVLPVTNYTYDLYSINGQGISGMFQPNRSQVGYVYDKYVKDISKDRHLGIEVGPGAYVHVGVEYRSSPSESSTGLWASNNAARANFIENTNSSNKAYEKVFYKSIGELNVDNDANLLSEQLGGEEPIKLELIGSNFAKETNDKRYLKGTGSVLNPAANIIDDEIKRSERLIRNQAIQPITKVEADILYANYEDAPQIYSDAEDHHNVATRILQPDGSTYVFGQPAYNTKKVEATFNTSYRGIGTSNATEELVKYGSNDNTVNNSRGQDNYFNRVETPAYVHSYLLSEVLSSDYEDLTGNGPTDDDLGAYTKIHYNDYGTAQDKYLWRVPFQADMATSNKGFNSLKEDDMGNYIYGEKELFYVEKIETKTHIAVFDLNVRNDGYGVNDENGGLSETSKMYQINKIYLYSKPVYKHLTENETIDFETLDEDIKSRSAIKVAHFEYDYSLCKNLPNNINYNPTDVNDDDGKLTLKKIYFTYRGSNMGKYTPYKFNYEGINPDYHIKGYNLWGNYKNPQVTGMGLNSSNDPTTAEFPYVDQTDRVSEDENASAWTMTSINLPSGGKLQMTYEADDYGYVQNKRAMQMFKVRGVGATNNLSGFNASNSDLLYETLGLKKRYIYIELPNESSSDLPNQEEFIQQYLSDIIDDPIYFKFLLNMVKGKSGAYDFVSGYFKMDHSPNKDFFDRPIGFFSSDSKAYAAIPVRLVDKSKVKYDDNGESPFTKAGWYFGRQYMNRTVYGQTEVSNFNPLDIAETIVGQIGGMFALFNEPNTEIKNKGCAQKFSTTKSWIRLQSPNRSKIGGGIRVSRIEMFDQWDKMTDNDNDELYKMSYGQEYNYQDTEGNTSGVAAFEPFGSKENPFVEPFDDDIESDRFLAPQEQNFTEKPFGISFFPSPKVTYSRVTVGNLNRGTYTNDNTVLEVGNNGTGMVINEFYTSKDFPTIAKHTVLGQTNVEDFPEGGVSIIASTFGLNFITKKRISMSQGFTVITNDMDGKSRSQMVFAESAANEDAPISKVEYLYNVDENENLYHDLPVIKADGSVMTATLGIDYNVINDFRRSKSNMETYGADVNLGVLPSPAFGIPFGIGTIMPQLAFHDTDMRMATTTKVIHKTGILIEKKAFDLGAEVTTKNIAWDAQTGQVLLTETDNEYKDKYYNFSYPAYWNYEGMSSASNNLGIELNLEYQSDHEYNIIDVATPSQYLYNGDELLIDNETIGWVTNVNESNFSIIIRNGTFLDSASKLKVIRSGYRNLQSANMASITLMQNPIDLNNDYDIDGTYDPITASTFDTTNWDEKRIINASAVRYSDEWAVPCECNMPQMSFDESGELIFTHEGSNPYNPYLYNVKGDWRAVESYAYLTGRFNSDDDFNPRNSGFFRDYSAFYKPDGNGNWTMDLNKWTSASQVTQYSAYGAELENKDALNRYSSAQYGFNDNFPVAVASNSEYREIGFDSFEEDRSRSCESGHFLFIDDQGATSEIVNSESHTGNRSIRVNTNQAISMQKTITRNCKDPEDVDIGILMTDLINAIKLLIKNHDPIIDDSENPCFTIPEFEAIKPFVIISSGFEPQLCDIISFENLNQNQNEIRFSFEHSSLWQTAYPEDNCTASQCFPYNVIVEHDDISYVNLDVDITEYNGNPYEDGGLTYPRINVDNQGFSSGRLRFKRATVTGIQIPGFCPECTSFSPKMNQRYILSSWVKVAVPTGGNTPQELLDGQPLSYDDVAAQIEYLDNDLQIIPGLEVLFVPTGEIIDGWQRIANVFDVPSNSEITYMNINLINGSSNQAFFDDVRIHPYSGNMKTFVYDNANYRLMSELDENNYATFYEYDNEGGLVRVKKETERGIMTIQETRSGTTTANN